eukprot:3079403-Rhodomonas_salina.1
MAVCDACTEIGFSDAVQSKKVGRAWTYLTWCGVLGSRMAVLCGACAKIRHGDAGVWGSAQRQCATPYGYAPTAP